MDVHKNTRNMATLKNQSDSALSEILRSINVNRSELGNLTRLMQGKGTPQELEDFFDENNLIGDIEEEMADRAERKYGHLNYQQRMNVLSRLYMQHTEAAENEANFILALEENRKDTEYEQQQQQEEEKKRASKKKAIRSKRRKS